MSDNEVKLQTSVSMDEQGLIIHTQKYDEKNYKVECYVALALRGIQAYIDANGLDHSLIEQLVEAGHLEPPTIIPTIIPKDSKFEA